MFDTRHRDEGPCSPVDDRRTLSRERRSEATMNYRTNDLADPSPISRPVLHCPRCRSTHLDPVVEAVVADVHFLCRDCGRCWHAGFGSVSRVAPPTCFGCPRRERCEQVYAADHPEQQRGLGAR
jgi:hypothetical protein